MMSRTGGLRNSIEGTVGMLIIVVLVFSSAAIISFAIDGLYQQTIARCYVQGENFTRVFMPSTVGDTFEKTVVQNEIKSSKVAKGDTSGCKASVTATRAIEATGLDVVLYTEHEEEVTATASGAVAKAAVASFTFGNDAEWRTPLPVVNEYVEFTQLVIEVLPILQAASLMAYGAFTIVTNRGTSGAIANSVIAIIVQIVLTIFLLIVLPIIFLAVNAFFILIKFAGLPSVERFGGVIDLVVGVIPTLLVIGTFILVGSLGGYAALRSTNVIGSSKMGLG